MSSFFELSQEIYLLYLSILRFHFVCYIIYFGKFFRDIVLWVLVRWSNMLCRRFFVIILKWWQYSKCACNFRCFFFVVVDLGFVLNFKMLLYIVYGLLFNFRMLVLAWKQYGTALRFTLRELMPLASKKKKKWLLLTGVISSSRK